MLFIAIPGRGHAADGSAQADSGLSFDIDDLFYEDSYRTFNVDFSSGTEESFGNLNLSGTWTSNDAGADHDPNLQFAPQNGNSEFFEIDTGNDVYQVRIPKPLNALPTVTASNTIDWSSEPYYIHEGSGIDFRSLNPTIAASENVELTTIRMLP